MSAVMLLCIK